MGLNVNICNLNVPFKAIHSFQERFMIKPPNA